MPSDGDASALGSHILSKAQHGVTVRYLEKISVVKTVVCFYIVVIIAQPSDLFQEKIGSSISLLGLRT